MSLKWDGPECIQTSSAMPKADLNPIPFFANKALHPVFLRTLPDGVRVLLCKPSLITIHAHPRLLEHEIQRRLHTGGVRVIVSVLDKLKQEMYRGIEEVFGETM